MARSKAGQSQNMAKLRFDNGFGCLPAAALMLLLAWASTGACSVRSEKAAKGAPAAAAAAPAADAGLKARVETLEEQLVDMQVVVGTLESLGKNGGSAPAAFPAGFGRRGCGAHRRSRDAGSGSDGRASAAIRSGSQSWRQPAPWRYSFEYEHGGDGARPIRRQIMAEAPAAGLVRRRYRREAVAMPSADCWTVMRRLRPPHRPPQLEAPMEECRRARA